MRDVKEIRRLVIKTFHVKKLEFSDKTKFIDGVLYLRRDIDNISINNEYIKSVDVKVIYPENHNVFINSILDFCPIATKVLGRVGEGITHVLTGVTAMLTGVDEDGVQVAEFGSSEGILSEQVYFDRAGTPSKDDIIIHVDMVFKSGMGINRAAVTEAHKISDAIVQEIREQLKQINGRYCDEKHEFFDTIKPGRKKVVIVKQVAGQGAMYDTALFGKEPGGAIGSKSIIDMGNVPIILTPNEYRDGALRAMH